MRSGINDVDKIEYVECDQEVDVEDGENVKCGWEGWVDVTYTPYERIWLCERCDYQHEENYKE